MKVLFISREKQKSQISPKILNQGASLKKAGLTVEYFQIVGKGFKGYLSSIPKLRKIIRENKYDIYHAHYSLSGIIASLARAKPLIVSLMGSDIYQYKWLRFISVLFCRFSWDVTITKSEEMKMALPELGIIVLPNGVDLEMFKVFPDDEIRKKFPDKKVPWVLFVGHPTMKEKNRILAESAMNLIDDFEFEFVPLHNVEHNLLPYYMNAASVLLLTSLWEGSPNVIKEAMAVNLPIISVDVGDVKKVISKTKGCYLVSYDKAEIAKTTLNVLKNNNRTQGRNAILHLSTDNIALKLKQIYNTNLQLDSNYNPSR